MPPHFGNPLGEHAAVERRPLSRLPSAQVEGA